MPGGFHPPPSVIASWPEPNYVDPEVRGKELIVFNGVLGIASLLAVAARLFVRVKIQRRLGPDDLFLTLGLIVSAAQTGMFVYAEAQFRWHRHVWDIPPIEHPFRQMHSWIVQLLIAVSSSFIKASVLLLYKRVIKETANPKFLVIINLAIASIFAYFAIFSLLAVLQCIPVESFWEQFSDDYHEDFYCLPESNAPVANAIFSIITDFVTALLPITLFTQLKVPRAQKVSLCILFGVGFILCILGVVKAVFLHRIFFESYDSNWIGYNVWTLTAAENYIGVICSAIPPLRGPIVRYFSKNVRCEAFHDHFKKKKDNTNTGTTNSSGYTLDEAVFGGQQPSFEPNRDSYRASGTLFDKNIPHYPEPYSVNTTKPLPKASSQLVGREGAGTDTIV
ncbi:hypothetical protein FQN54_008715 [Arachnomyces sp. PD_36]|nr:hypothetical protein FQN54_008715 [Arachnomyces sp. PD_36]